VSPDGTELAFAVKWTGANRMSTQVSAASGAGAYDVHAVGGENHKVASPAFSSDGKTVVRAQTDYGESRLVKEGFSASANAIWFTAAGQHFVTPGWHN
jgi:hypothetical protein